jgi:hypothetical protein
MNKNEQAKIADEIVMSAALLDGRKLKVGEAYEKIMQRKGHEFRDKVKELPSDAFNASIISNSYKP